MDRNETKEVDKREKIINAALKEFSKNGYKKTSIDEIVLEAGVSKGLVFHYFGSKKKLYLYLYEYCLKIMSEEIIQDINIDSMDVFQRYSEVQRAKFIILKRHPYFSAFLIAAYYEENPQVYQELKVITEYYAKEQGVVQKAMSNIDYSGLIEGVSPDVFHKIVAWVSEGYLKEATGKLSIEENLEVIFNDFDKYMRALKLGFYKEGEF